MSRLQWDETGKRFYETGVEKVVLYPMTNAAYGTGVPWNGVTSIQESPSGAESTAIWADNIKYLNLISNEEFKATIEAYTYPDEFKACDGTSELATGLYAKQQTRSAFGLSYMTKVGNDVDGADHASQIHIIYGCKAAPSQKQYQTMNESPEAMTLSWELSTTPVDVPGFKPTAQIVIETKELTSEKLTTLQNILWGGDETQARLPLPSELVSLLGTEG